MNWSVLLVSFRNRLRSYSYEPRFIFSSTFPSYAVIDDGAHCIKNLVKDNRFVAGGGACEIELAHRLQVLTFLLHNSKEALVGLVIVS